MKLRWDPYFMRSGDAFVAFWHGLLHSKERNLLYVLGHGFDPRMCSAYQVILGVGGSGKRDCLLLEFHEGASSPSRAYSDSAKRNRQHLEKIQEPYGEIKTNEIKMWSDDGTAKRRVGSISAESVFQSSTDLAAYTDVIVDISAMPRSIYFSLIGKILFLLDNWAGSDVKPNLHIVVAENAHLDKLIVDKYPDDSARYIHGLESGMELESTSGVPKLWIPMLGENQTEQLLRINDLVQPDEVCPLLPSPATNPRRADSLILEYRELLFEQLRIETRNIMYASERNPFEAYRQIVTAAYYYNESLTPVGGCNIAISALSSKLLSIGALLAAYELKSNNIVDIGVGLAHVEAQGYDMLASVEDTNVHQELFTLWLAGECHES